MRHIRLLLHMHVATMNSGPSRQSREIGPPQVQFHTFDGSAGSQTEMNTQVRKGNLVLICACSMLSSTVRRWLTRKCTPSLRQAFVVVVFACIHNSVTSSRLYFNSTHSLDLLQNNAMSASSRQCCYNSTFSSHKLIRFPRYGQMRKLQAYVSRPVVVIN